MMIRALGVIGMMAMSACYQDVSNDVDAAARDKELNLLNECRLNKRTGCFDGQVASAQNIQVKGKNFFDANALRLRFKELLNITDSEGQRLSEDSYELTYLAPFDNENFAAGMQAHLKGPYAKSARVMRSGKFAFHELPQGEYDIRVQKSLPFTVSQTLAATPNEDGTAGKPKVNSKTYCATLYADSSVEVRSGQRAQSQVFDSFELYVLDRECNIDEEANGLSL